MQKYYLFCIIIHLFYIFAKNLYNNFKHMKTKELRFEAIKKIIGSHKIKNQEDLLSKLVENGFDFTQATLSRDLKQLQIVKKPEGDVSYYYILPENTVKNNAESNLKGFLSIDFSNNIGVIKTLPGFASIVAIEIDNLQINKILGTVAGDDTIIMVIKDQYKDDVIEALISAVPRIKSYLKNYNKNE